MDHLRIIKANHDRSIDGSVRVFHERVDWMLGVNVDVDVIAGRVDLSLQIGVQMVFERRLIIV